MEVADTQTVLVGIVTRNRAGIVPRAIESALKQDYKRVCVAVIDDGSTDDTPQLEAKFPTVSWQRRESPGGYLDARNQLMSSAAEDFYLSLDDDAWFLGDDVIRIAIDHFAAHPRVAAIAFDILSPDRPSEERRRAARPTHAYIGCGHVLRLSALKEVGYYANSPGSYGAEEKDLCLRLRDRGWEIHLLPGVHVWHEKTPLQRDLTAQHRSGVCNDLTFALRRCPWPMLLWVLPFKILSHLRFALHNQLLMPCLNGFGLFFRSWRSVWQSRQPVRAATFREFVRASRAVS